jgi:two-component system phosphate regulon sensor histidine kinase PhoR
LRSFQWKITIPLIVFIIASMSVLGFYVTNFVKNSQLDNLRSHLEQEARITAEAVLPLLQSHNSPDLLAKTLGEEIDSRVTIIAPDGTVLGDSVEEPATMENHGTRPEVIDALTSGIGESTRYSTTLAQQMMYVAITVSNEGQILGIARVALPITTVDNYVNHVTRIIILAVVIVTILAILAAWLIARTVTRPIRQLTKVSKEMATGQLGQKITISTQDEIGQLAQALNEMSANLKTTVDAISAEKTKLKNILDNMADGVILTDNAGTVILANRTSGKLFGFKEDDVIGKHLIEVVHDHEVDEILRQCLKTGQEQATQFESNITRRFIRAIAIPLNNRDQLSGALVLLQDLTELKNLQTTRRDLIGNISHELRTPIAGIKAMVETLQSSAIDDKEAAQQFLSRIQDEVDRLYQIVSEVTYLSRIETGKVELKMESANLNSLLDDVIAEMNPLAERQEVTIVKEFSSDLPSVKLDKDRIRQTAINLVHNAIKFNKTGGKVTIATSYNKNSVTVSIADTGIGIAKEDLPRVFERFYKADKARTSGGSGLGLAIAKHTIQAHGGEIRAESIEGKGSTFTFRLPRQ